MDDFYRTIVNVPYFSDRILATRMIGNAYSQGKEFEEVSNAIVLPEHTLDENRAWSPSALEIFFTCPKRFYLKYIEGIPDEQPDDPTVVIPPAVLGSMAHSMMEYLANSKLSEKDFLTQCEKTFNEFLKVRPPIQMDDARKEKDEFLRMMKNAYRQDPHNEVLAAEKEYSFTHPSGIRLHGYPDRVEKTSDGRYIIADYKTKRTVEHTKNDIETCLQVIIYAWLCHRANIPVESCEYRYIRKGLVVPCSYDSFTEELLNQKLCAFKKSLEDNVFPRNPGKLNKNCKYCTMSDLCVSDEKNAEDMEDKNEA